MAWTQADVDELKAAIGAGHKSVRYGNGNAVEYHSLQEMMQALSAMESEVSQSSSGRSTYASFSRD